MGLVLRQVLRTLCGVNQWCYAVFWKIGSQNPNLLIWEECHYKAISFSARPCTSVIEGGLEAYLDSDTHSSGDLLGDRIHVLINKMMMNNQVNVVGEGLIGRAAFTGKHEWILVSNYMGDSHPPEVLNELNHQFSAGMQTVAVIPVFPHGVVQLGSTLAMMENIGFVNIVKSLILQLGRVPGAVLSDNCIENECPEQIGVPISLGVPLTRMSGDYKVPHSTSLLAGSFDQQCISSQALRFVDQPSCSQIRQIEDGKPFSGLSFHSSNLTKTSSKSLHGQCELKISAMVNPSEPFRCQQENRAVGAEVITLSPDAQLKNQASSYNSKLLFSHQTVDQPNANGPILKSLERQILSGYGAPNLMRNDTITLDSFMATHRMTKCGSIISSHGDSHTYGRDLTNELSGQRRPTSIPCSLSNQLSLVDANHGSTHLAGVVLQNADSPKAEDVLNQLSAATGILSGCSDCLYHSMKHTNSVSTAKKEKINCDLFRALNIPSEQSNEPLHVSVGLHMAGSINDCLKNANGSPSTIIADAKYENPCDRPPSADDLYDVLGVDFKSKLLSVQQYNFTDDRPLNPCSKAQDMGSGVSTLMNIQEASSDLCVLNQVKSEKSSFRGMETDHLLDAVVSKAHNSAKQSSYDVSCRTALTKISSSSVPSDSHTYGQIDVSDQAQGDLFNVPNCQEKAGTIASSSFKSGCSKDDIESCSQSTSIFRPQLSTWVEQGNNVRRDSSVSTAFSKKNDETSKPNRKRLKPGENPRPRPKDRQMIQDRVKELREIVPNGAKCSIDALLERTIKHMLFLQSVTKYADKLKQAGDSKIMKKERGLLLKENSEGGATWAFEVGSQSMICPIIVEDLNPPGQMLVEMLCEDRGFFLEIADLIRGLGLTILKGVMEARNDRIWACFVVEANRDVTRMEIFMSLVQLLEQTVRCSASSANALENSNMLGHHAFHQSTSIPATGRLNSFQ